MTDGPFDRACNWGQRLFTSTDQWLGTLLRGPFYIAGVASLPSADETISAFVGRNAIEGKRWALIAERVINFFAGPGHCRHAISTDDSD